MVGTIKTDNSERQIKWFHTPNASAPRGRGRGGTLNQPSLFDVDGHKLIFRGYLDRSFSGLTNQETQNNATDVLIVGAIPPLRSGYMLGLMKNNKPIALSITPESLDMKGRHCHYFQEVVELSSADEITIAVCGYVGESQSGWRDNLHIESRLIELDTLMGHLAFIVLDAHEDDGTG